MHPSSPLPTPLPQAAPQSSHELSPQLWAVLDLRQLALHALQQPDPVAKCAATQTLTLSGTHCDASATYTEPADLPGKSARPILVHPTQVKQRSVHTALGRATLIHSLAHIELNAVNLALDIMWRFGDLPPAFYVDWLSVAQDEARHFGLLQQHLQTLGHDYGDFPAHNGLWDMAEKTKTDLLARLALVPRTLEARGLDMSPLIRDKLKLVGDLDGAAILDVILTDEIRHVAIGNHWYRWACTRQDLDPIAAYAAMAQTYQAPKQRGPFNLDARRAAGFDESELAALVAMV